MNTKRKLIKLYSGEWLHEKIPCILIKHRVTKTDPTYKMVLNSDVYVRSNVAIRESNGSYYYDLLNILAPSEAVVTPEQWLDFLSSEYNISFETDGNYASSVFPELSFVSADDRDLFDELYNSLSRSMLSDGLNSYLDFTIQMSHGFIRNKLQLDLDSMNSWVVDNLSINLLTIISEKDNNSNNFKIKNQYKTSLSLTTNDIVYIEELLNFNSTLMPRNSINVPYIWDLRNKFENLNISAKQYLMNFSLEKISIINILNKDFSMDVSANNEPSSVKIKNGTYIPNSQRIFLS